MKKWIHASTDSSIDVYERVASPAQEIELIDEAAETLYDHDPTGLLQKYCTRITLPFAIVLPNGRITTSKDNPIGNFDIYMTFRRANGQLDGTHIFRAGYEGKPVDPTRLAKKAATQLRRKLDYLLSKQLLKEQKAD